MEQDEAALEVWRSISGEVQRLVENVRPEQWHDPTPCTEWDVRQLVAHIVTGFQRFTLIARGQATQPPAQGAPPSDPLGDDPAAAFRAAAEALTAEFERPGFFAGTYQSPIGELPGDGLIRMRQTELMIHGWDLAHATGQRASFPDEVVEQTLAQMQRTLEGRPREQSPFGPAQPVADDAPPLERLVAFLGRRV